MRSLLAISGAMVCALSMTACMTDDSPAPGDQSTSEDAVDQTGGQLVTVPPELAFERPEGTYDGNTFTAHPDACHVTLKFCRDASKHNVPSFCQNGGCTESRALGAAISLCESICGNIDCTSVLFQYPNSPSC